MHPYKIFKNLTPVYVKQEESHLTSHEGGDLLPTHIPFPNLPPASRVGPQEPPPAAPAQLGLLCGVHILKSSFQKSLLSVKLQTPLWEQ